MIACVSSNLTQVEETINTLGYASRAANIKVVEKANSVNLEEYEHQCEKCSQKTKIDLRHLFKNSQFSQNHFNNPTTTNEASEPSTLQLQLKYTKLFDELREQMLRILC